MTRRSGVLGGLALVVVLVLVTAATAGRRGGETIRIVAVGDIAMAPSSDGGDGLFSRVSLDLVGDVVLGNLEGTLASGGSSKCRPQSRHCYTFRAPPSYASVLRRAGFTILNLANNHAWDYGAQGQRETLAALARAGLRTTGRPGETALLRVGPATVAVLGFAPYPWAQDLRDLRQAQRLVRRAVEAGDLVVVTMHAGAEGKEHAHVRPGRETFLGENRGDVVRFAHAVVDAGADLVVGHGPHVLRGMEWYRGRLIAYSLGNFLGNRTLNYTGISGVSGLLRVSLRPDGAWVAGELVAIRLVPPGVPAPDPEGAARGVVRKLSREDFGRRGMLVSPAGLLRPPAR